VAESLSFKIIPDIHRAMQDSDELNSAVIGAIEDDAIATGKASNARNNLVSRSAGLGMSGEIITFACDAFQEFVGLRNIIFGYVYPKFFQVESCSS
jgi:hypothetical protein